MSTSDSWTSDTSQLTREEFLRLIDEGRQAYRASREDARKSKWLTAEDLKRRSR